MSALFIAAIHNGEFADSPAAVVVSRIEELFPGSQVQGISRQDAFENSPNIDRLRKWASRQWALERQWRRYLGLASSVRDVLATAGELLWRLRIASQADFRERAWGIRQVEVAVSRKHQEAWTCFQASDHQFALIVESDAIWTPDSDPGLSAIAERFSIDTPMYVNLAGGLDTRELSIVHLRSSSSEAHISGFTRYRSPVTNTSCAYIVNRSMAGLLLEQCRASPEVAALGIDWIINATFMTAHEKGVEVQCWHAEPPVLLHGSTSGVTKSWHPDR